MATAACPACAAQSTRSIYPSFSGTCVTSDLEILPSAQLDNRICTSCGLIFNAAGTRGASHEFYRDSYSLMTRSAQAGIQSFHDQQPMLQAERTYILLKKLVKIPPSGVLLEAGAGKGTFLSLFVNEFPGWTAHAFEPSRSFDYLVKAVPTVRPERCDYLDYSLDGELADLVVALGVLEHVEDPLDMLIWGNRQLRDGGAFYIRVPNFASNPNDLFCADHLSKLTVPTLRIMADAAGFAVESIEEGGVPVFVLLRKQGVPSRRLRTAHEENSAIADANAAVAKSLVEAVIRCREVARAKGEKFGIFGLASAGLCAPFVGNFDVSEIAAYIDENQTMWGSIVHGRPVGGIELIKELGIRHIALSLSPIYFEQVKAKLAPLGISVYPA